MNPDVCSFIVQVSYDVDTLFHLYNIDIPKSKNMCTNMVYNVRICIHFTNKCLAYIGVTLEYSSRE